MKTSIETERLFFREFVETDDLGIFELDSDTEVHKYLGNNPVTTIGQCRDYLANVMDQYRTNGIGRWAMIVKQSGEFAGWAGLKIEKNVNGHQSFYDLGYRIIRKHWGNGFATEAAKAFVDYGFDQMKIPVICAYTSAGNIASQKVLERSGFSLVNTFEYDGASELWYEIRNPHIG